MLGGSWESLAEEVEGGVGGWVAVFGFGAGGLVVLEEIEDLEEVEDGERLEGSGWPGRGR